MLENLFRDPEVARRLRRDPFGAHLDSFATSLSGCGYSLRTVKRKLWLLASFSRWTAERGGGLGDVDERMATGFLADRLEEGRLKRGQAHTVEQFMFHLRAGGLVSLSAPSCERALSAQDSLVARFETYLLEERGLAMATTLRYGFFARRFLDRFGSGLWSPRELRPRDAWSFILDRSGGMSRGWAKLLVTSLRSFFRFLLVQGEIDTDLAAAVPTVASWRLSSIPKYLPPDQVQRLLATCDRSTPNGRRDYAILLLLSRLGLRAGEVVKLELDDLNWRAAEITVPGKGLIRDRLPLLSDVGEAVASYVRWDRPEVQTRRLFLCMKAPHRGFAGPAAVCAIVCGAIKRSGLDPARKGAHLLRHGLATQMIREGASLAEIAEVLRHRSPATTEIYAKVDTTGLRSLALPWPNTGGSR